jgi:hypothetical protein
LDSYDLNRERKIEQEVGEHVNEIIIPREARGAGPIPKPRFYRHKGIVDPPSIGMKKFFQNAVCYFDGWSRRRKNMNVPQYVLEEIKNDYSWVIPDQPTKRYIRQSEKYNNVVLGFGQSQMKHLT